MPSDKGYKINDRVRLTDSIWDDGQDHHPPGYLARRGEIVIIRNIEMERAYPLGVSHEDRLDNYFLVSLAEVEPE